MHKLLILLISQIISFETQTKERIKREEGLRLKAYLLPNEPYYTIGYGHHSPNIKKN